MNVEQRAAIKFCVKNGFSRIQIIEYRGYCSEKNVTVIQELDRSH